MVTRTKSEQQVVTYLLDPEAELGLEELHLDRVQLLLQIAEPCHTNRLYPFIRRLFCLCGQLVATVVVAAVKIDSEFIVEVWLRPEGEGTALMLV